MLHTSYLVVPRDLTDEEIIKKYDLSSGCETYQEAVVAMNIFNEIDKADKYSVRQININIFEV